MPITSFHDDLPSKRPGPEGLKHDGNSVFGTTLVDWLAATNEPREPKEREYIRPSDALSCARKVSYVANGTAGTEMEPSGMWNVTLGNNIHQMMGEATRAAYPDAQVEVQFDTTISIGDVDVPVVSYVDAFIPSLGLVTDFKSIGGFGYKMAIGERGTPQGAKPEHLIQAGIGALLCGASKVSVTYISKEAISIAVANRKGFSETERFCAEWTVDLDDIRPQVEAEILRLWGINRLWHDEHTLASRKVPGIPVEISAPRDGSYVQKEIDPNTGIEIVLATGSYWGCNYCSYQQVCISDGGGRVTK